MIHNKITIKGVRMFLGYIRWQVWYQDRLHGNYVYWENAMRCALRMAEKLKP